MIDSERLKRLKLIVMDLDGTLLNSKAQIGEETKKLINKLKDKDVLFTFASGRLHSALISYAEELDLKVPLISLDGTVIKSYPDNNIVFESFVPEKYVVKALQLSDRYLLNIALCHADEIFFTERNSVIPQIMNKFGAKYTEVDSYNNYLDQTLEIVFAGDFKENIKYVRDRFAFPHAFGLNVSYFRSQTHDGVFYLEIRKKGFNKGKALLKLLKHLKIKVRDIAVIGDWYNDNSLFELNSLNVTLKNGIPELKRNAHIVTNKSNDEDGVAEFLEMVLKAKS